MLICKSHMWLLKKVVLPWNKSTLPSFWHRYWGVKLSNNYFLPVGHDTRWTLSKPKLVPCTFAPLRCHRMWSFMCLYTVFWIMKNRFHIVIDAPCATTPIYALSIPRSQQLSLIPESASPRNIYLSVYKRTRWLCWKWYSS